jgi:hypothetical protein
MSGALPPFLTCYSYSYIQICTYSAYKYVALCRQAAQALQNGLPAVLARRIGAWVVVPGSSLTHHHSERSFLHLQLPGDSDVEIGHDSQWEKVPGENRETGVTMCYGS